MRTNHLFPGDVILQRADQIELRLHRRNGKTAGVEFKVTGFLMDPFVEDEDGDTIPEDAIEAQAILRALLEGGAA